MTEQHVVARTPQPSGAKAGHPDQTDSKPPTELTLVSHKLCPYVQRAAIALAEKSAPFARVDIDLAAKPEWFGAISPMGKVPLLRVARRGGEETVLFESNVICEYIEETQPGSRLHPDDPLQRAHHRGWMEFASSILADLWIVETTQDFEAFEDKRSATARKFGMVEQALGEGPFFAGTRLGLVDAAFAPIFRYFDLFDTLTDLDIFTRVPKVRAWRAALSTRASVRNAVGADYIDLLRAFLVGHDAYLLQRARRAS